jgi:RNA polymerase sigma factor (sigma-70 family)
MKEPVRVAGSSLMRCQTDARLVELVRAGSAPAFEAIVERYSPPLMRYCRRLLPPARAEDAVQQTFVNAYTALSRDESKIELRPWLYRIARNVALNALTRDRECSSPHVAELPEVGESVHDEVERRFRLRAAFEAVQTLPERQRDAVVLRELEGRSYEQIATELDVTGGAVRQLLSRARDTLRAAATAVTPIALLVRIPWGPASHPVLTRVGEVASDPGAPTGIYKAAVTAVAAAALVGGLAEGGPKTAKLLDRGSGGDRDRGAPPLVNVREPGVAAPRAAGGRGGGGGGAYLPVLVVQADDMLTIARGERADGRGGPSPDGARDGRGVPELPTHLAPKIVAALPGGTGVPALPPALRNVPSLAPLPPQPGLPEPQTLAQTPPASGGGGTSGGRDPYLIAEDADRAGRDLNDDTDVPAGSDEGEGSTGANPPVPGDGREDDEPSAPDERGDRTPSAGAGEGQGGAGPAATGPAPPDQQGVGGAQQVPPPAGDDDD